MKAKIFKGGILIAAIVLGVSCKAPDVSEEGLKEALEGKFLMGAALNPSIFTGRDTASLRIISKHFSSVVAENCMKSERIHPEEAVFDFELADKFIDFATQKKLHTVGHCLIWHSQSPDWLFVDEDGNDVSREILIERISAHITTIVERYKGKVEVWDVVNEAFEDDGSWRNTKFYQIIGEDYIELAFLLANEADPDAELIYNDYSMFHQGRREAVVKLVKNLQAKGIRIDGVGMQAHSGMDYPPLEEFEKSMIAFADCGMDVHITEMDITAIPFPDGNVGAEVSSSFEYQERMNPYANGLTDSARLALHDRYLDFFELFLQHKDKIKRVTMWGIADHHSWRQNWPIRGRSDFPLLFDREYQAKPIVESIIKAAKNEESQVPG